MTEHSPSYSDMAELARKAALFREGTKRIYDGAGARADMWYFELWHFLGDVQAALSSDGGQGGQPFVSTDAVEKAPAPSEHSGKHEGRTGFKVGAEQTPGSSMSSGRTAPIIAGQAPGPSEATFTVAQCSGDCGAKAYVERAIASYAGDPADNNFQRGFLAALEVVRDEAFALPSTVRCTCRPLTRYAGDEHDTDCALSSTSRESDPNIAPCDDAEFGMKP